MDSFNKKDKILQFCFATWYQSLVLVRFLLGFGNHYDGLSGKDSGKDCSRGESGGPFQLQICGKLVFVIYLASLVRSIFLSGYIKTSF